MIMEKQYKKMQDHELLAILEHDEKAFNEIYERYHRLVYFVAYELCHNDADAKDVLQETFIKVRHAAKNVREEGKFKYWLNAVTVSKCKDLFKKNKFRGVSEEADTRFSLREERRYMLPEQQMHFESDQALLHHFIAQLPQSQREVLVLKYFSELSLQEIADIMQISEGTVKSRLHYAKDGLRGMIETYHGRANHAALDFKSLDVLLPTAFLYAFQHQPLRLSLPVWKGRTHSAFGIGTVSVTLTALCLAGAILFYQSTQSNTAPSHAMNQESEIRQYRQAYFTLLDFAANRYDMEAKTKDQLASVYAQYVLLRDADNEYYRLLAKQNWVSMYETALAK